MDIRITVQPDRARRRRGLRVLAGGEWDLLGRLLGGVFMLAGIFAAVGMARVARAMDIPGFGGRWATPDRS
jgi:hypothetical protein